MPHEPLDDVELLIQRAENCLVEQRYAATLEACAAILARAPGHEGALAWTVVCHRRNKAFDQAHAAVQHALQQLPDSLRLLHEQVEIFVDQKRYEDALATCAKMLDKQPDYEDALASRVSCQRNRKAFEQAQAAVELGLQRLPGSAKLRNEQAWIHFDQKRYDAALEAFARTLDNAPANEDALEWTVTCHRFRRAFEQAEAAVELGLQRLPNSVKLQNERAWIYYNQERYADTLSALATTLEKAPNDEEALAYTVACHRLRKAYDQAQAALELGLQRLPRSVRLLNEQAEIFFDQKRYDDALAAYAKTLDVAADDEDALAAMVACHRLNKAFEQALTCAELGLQRLPDSVRLLNQRAWTYSDQKQYEAAVSAFARTLDKAPDDEAALSWTVYCHRRRKAFDEAQAAVELGLQRLPESVPLWHEQADIHLDQGRDEAFLSTLAKILEIAPNNEDALVWTATCQLRRSALDQAQAAVERGFERLPDSVRLLNVQAAIFYRQERYDAALSTFTKTLDKAPDNEEALEWTVACHRARKAFDAAQTAVARGLQRLPNSVKLRNEQAYIFFDQQRYDDALAAFARTLDVAPDDEPALAVTAACHRERKAFDQAEAAVEFGLQRLPDSVSLRNQRAWIYLEHKRYDAALAAFAETLEKEPDNELALVWIVTCERRRCAYDAAQTALDRALQRLPGSVELQNEQARLYQDQRRYADALATYEKVLKLQPYDENAHNGVVSCQRQLRAFDLARAAVERTLARLPDNIRARSQEPWIYFEQQQFEAAIAASNKLLQRDPRNQTALVCRSKSYRKLRAYKEALEAVEAGLRLDKLPKSVDLFLERAAIYDDQQDYEQALKALKQAHAIAPQDEAVLEGLASCHRARKSFSEAQAIVERGLAHDPYSVDLLVQHALVAQDQGEWKLALQRLDRARALDPMSSWIAALRLACQRRIGSTSEVLEAAESALHTAAPKAHVLHEAGLIFVHTGALERAVEAFERALLRDGSWLKPAYDLAATLLRLQRPLDAVQRLEAVKAAYPRDEQAAYELGMLFLSMKEPLRAAQAFEELLTHKPDSLWARAGMAALRYEQGRFDEAADLFAEVAQARPEFWVHHARALAKLGTRDDLRRALELCLQARKRDPQDMQALACLGFVYYRLDRWSEAEAALRRAVELDPILGPWRDLGSLYAQQARFDEALEHITTAIKTNPHDTRAFIELGGIYLEQKRTREGVSALRRALATHRGSPDAIQALANGLLSSGDVAGAERELRQGLKRIDPAQSHGLCVLLAQTLRELGGKTTDEQLLREALMYATRAIRAQPSAAEAYFERGMIENALGDPRAALRSFSEVLNRDREHLEAQRNHQRLTALFNKHRLEELARHTGWVLSGAALIMLAVTWILYFVPPDSAQLETSINAALSEASSAHGGALIATPPRPRITETMIITFTPIFFGLALIGLVLPVLTKLKLPGVEAELQQAKSSIIVGPTGYTPFVQSNAGPGHTPFASSVASPDLINSAQAPISKGPHGA